MFESHWRVRIARLICLTMAITVLSSAWTGCSLKNKKTDPGYGPGYTWVDDMRDRIQKKIDDPDKVTGLLAVVDKIELTLIDMDGDVKEYYTDLKKLDRDHSSSRADFQKAFDQFNSTRNQYFETMLGYIFEMKQIAGRENWQEVSDIDKTLYESWQRSL